MELTFTFRNVEPTEAIKEWANKRFQKVTKHLKEPADAHVTVSVDKHRHRAELTVRSGGQTYRAEEEKDDLYAALDGVMSKADVAIRRHKEKERSHH